MAVALVVVVVKLVEEVAVSVVVVVVEPVVEEVQVVVVSFVRLVSLGSDVVAPRT